MRASQAPYSAGQAMKNIRPSNVTAGPLVRLFRSPMIFWTLRAIPPSSAKRPKRMKQPVKQQWSVFSDLWAQKAASKCWSRRRKMHSRPLVPMPRLCSLQQGLSLIEIARLVNDVAFVSGRWRSFFRAIAETALDIFNNHFPEIGCECRSAQGRGLFPLDKYRRGRLFASAGQRDPDVGMLALARHVNDAAHYCDGECLYARVARLPRGHGLANETLDIGGELLERGRSGAPAAGTR